MHDKSISTSERLFASECVSAGRRLDGRSLTDPRHVSVTLGPSWGFAEVAFDNTLVIASTSVDATAPSSERPNEGVLTVVADLSPTSSEAAARESLARSGHTPVVTEIRNCIDKFVREARAIDTEALCILAGVKVWAVRVEVDIINDDGNCVDACVMAVMSSLMHARRPDVTVTGKEVRVHSLDEREPVPLPVHHVPLSVSFALFGAGKPYEPDMVVMDPVKKEEIASGGSLSFAFNAQGEVCGVYKAGGLPLQPESFVQCSELGEKRALKLTAILNKALADSSAKHPRASLRPMLVTPEPVAQVRSRHTRKKDEVMSEAAPLSMWNATPIEDTLPPPPSATDRDPVKVHAVEGVDSAIASLLQGRKEVDEIVQVEEHVEMEMEPEREDGPKPTEIIEISDSSSSDDDLESAIISKGKGSGGRR
ncbi:exosome component 9 Rrp45 [Chondrus crispus]|uniref:Exosome component 9 Rrp45 n=1 Tax=Chondrus crispus TaxID=2769 RepID=R7QM41_CHOCR|nr:exosome component 9 Rrp45 [Chondrus crispus]CDF38536.1 exosome component 9 Rrp45 [Chondrus crispus]|eukprot:XP_005718430.1 exosome component 9 Rrp45 [Chondrus crispus]